MLFGWDWSRGDTGRDHWKHENPEAHQAQWPETSGTLWLILEREKKRIGAGPSFLYPFPSAFLSYSLFQMQISCVCKRVLLPHSLRSVTHNPVLSSFGFILEKFRKSSPVQLCDAWAVALSSCQCKQGCQQAASRPAHTAGPVFPLVSHFLGSADPSELSLGFQVLELSFIALAISAEHPQALVLSADLLQAATAPFPASLQHDRSRF